MMQEWLQSGAKGRGWHRAILEGKGDFSVMEKSEEDKFREQNTQSFLTTAETEISFTALKEAVESLGGRVRFDSLLLISGKWV